MALRPPSPPPKLPPPELDSPDPFHVDPSAETVVMEEGIGRGGALQGAAGVPVPQLKPAITAQILLRQALVAKWDQALALLTSWDEGGTRHVTKPEFRRAVNSLGIVGARTEVDDLFDSFDTTNTALVDYRALGATLIKFTPKPAPPPPSKAMQEKLKDALGTRLNEMVDLFKKWDIDGNGLIDKAEFRKAVAALGVQYDDEIVDAVFEGYDADGSGEMEYKEYVRYSLRDALARSAGRVMSLFRQWDTDNSGSVDRKEFRKAITQLGFDAPRDTLDAVFSEMDKDGSGSVDFKELNAQLRVGALIKLKKELQKGAAGKISVQCSGAHSKDGKIAEGGACKSGAGSRGAKPVHGAKNLSASEKKERDEKGLTVGGLSPRSSAAVADVRSRPASLSEHTRNEVRDLREALDVQRAISLFSMMDADGSGLVDRSEFRKAVYALGLNATDAACDALFDIFDRDKSGAISYYELEELAGEAAAADGMAPVALYAYGEPKRKASPGPPARPPAVSVGTPSPRSSVGVPSAAAPSAAAPAAARPGESRVQAAKREFSERQRQQQKPKGGTKPLKGGSADVFDLVEGGDAETPASKKPSILKPRAASSHPSHSVTFGPGEDSDAEMQPESGRRSPAAF